MKNIVISADGDRKVFSVPDAVADHLLKYCKDFIKWLRNSPDATKYRMRGGLCYGEEDFIEYLNTRIFPNQRSKLVENLGWIDFSSPLPEPYVDCPIFNF
ncbi:MAG: hypothetical protein IKC63_07245 [Clostridia bacterium]|nr:hypothetical protein [Clostridia bacterium]